MNTARPPSNPNITSNVLFMISPSSLYIRFSFQIRSLFGMQHIFSGAWNFRPAPPASPKHLQYNDAM
jgi:hypothetical protein